MTDSLVSQQSHVTFGMTDSLISTASNATSRSQRRRRLGGGPGGGGGSRWSVNMSNWSLASLPGAAPPQVADLPSEEKIDRSFRRQWPLLSLNFFISDVEDGLGPLFNTYLQIRARMSINVRRPPSHLPVHAHAHAHIRGPVRAARAG